MHMSRIPGQSFPGLCHETWGNSELCRGALYHILEEPSSIRHLANFLVFESCLIYSWSGLCVPALDVNPEVLAVLPHCVIPGLVMYGAGYGIAKHSGSEMGHLYWVGWHRVRIVWDAIAGSGWTGEVVEFIFRCRVKISCFRLYIDLSLIETNLRP